jgi:3-hydroxyisobutyrate dehydrogenase-like beta-hydroxyacid dehydrogenase
MSQSVFVIGLGNMGAALARTLMNTGNQVTVWNRTTAKASPLVDDGATLADSVAQGVATNDITVICVGNYDDTQEVLKDADLRNKTIIQLTSAAASEATAMEDWMVQQGVKYVDGAILAFPRDVGSDACTLLVAGSLAAWQRAEQIVMQLGGSSVYLGDNVASPAAMDGALITPSLYALIGMIESCAMLEKAEVSIPDYLSMLTPTFSGGLGSDFQRQGMAIVNNEFSDTEASLGVWAAAINHGVEAQLQEGIELPMAMAVRDLLNKSVAAGYGDEELAAIIKVIRKKD